MALRIVTAFAIAFFLSAPAAAFKDPAVAVADAKRGTFVTLEGEVTRILDEDTFRLTDMTGDIRIYIGPNRMPVRIGDRVAVNGFVDDDFGPREVYADALETADGTIVTFDRRYD
jgi:uncharacterized protein YdeI (BOF family)